MAIYHSSHGRDAKCISHIKPYASPQRSHKKAPTRKRQGFFANQQNYLTGRIAGNRITSRIVWLLVNSITIRSIPMPRPAVGGKPCSSAVT